MPQVNDFGHGFGQAVLECDAIAQDTALSERDRAIIDRVKRAIAYRMNCSDARLTPQAPTPESETP